MVEIAVWSIRRPREILATSGSSPSRIERVLSAIPGQRVVDVRFGEQQSIVGFERGLRLSLSPQPDERGLANWTLFRGKHAALELTRHGRLRFPEVPGGLQAQLRVPGWIVKALKIGDRVRVLRLPENLRDDEVLHTKALFADCLGRVFPIVSITGHLIELQVGEVRGRPAYMETIWIEADCVEPA
jgi:hypothetical protein